MTDIKYMEFLSPNGELYRYADAYPVACYGMSCSICPLGRRHNFDEHTQDRYFLCDYPDRNPEVVLNFMNGHGFTPVFHQSKEEMPEEFPDSDFDDLLSIL